MSVVTNVILTCELGEEKAVEYLNSYPARAGKGPLGNVENASGGHKAQLLQEGLIMNHRIETDELNRIATKAMDRAEAELNKSPNADPEARNWRTDRDEDPAFFEVIKIVMACTLIEAGHDVEMPALPEGL